MDERKLLMRCKDGKIREKIGVNRMPSFRQVSFANKRGRERTDWEDGRRKRSSISREAYRRQSALGRS